MVRGAGNQREAVAAWHRLCATPEPEQPATPEPAALTVAAVVEAYLQHAETRIKANSFNVLRHRLLPFTRRFGADAPGGIAVRRVEAYIVSKGWSRSMYNGFVAALKACFAWAVEEGILTTNPVAKLEKPECQSRGAKVVILPEVHAKLVAAASRPLRALLELLWETGAHPSELTGLRIDDIDYAQAVARLEEHKTADGGKPRILVFTPPALEILREQSGDRETGYILRTLQANRWTKNAIATAVRSLCRKVGVKVTAYGYRHTYATRALSCGVPDATVSALLGHSGTTMLHKHYSHLTSNAKLMLDAAKRVSES